MCCVRTGASRYRLGLLVIVLAGSVSVVGGVLPLFFVGSFLCVCVCCMYASLLCTSRTPTIKKKCEDSTALTLAERISDDSRFFLYVFMFLFFVFSSRHDVVASGCCPSWRGLDGVEVGDKGGRRPSVQDGCSPRRCNSSPTGRVLGTHGASKVRT